MVPRKEYVKKRAVTKPPVKPLNKLMTEVPADSVQPAKTSKGGKIGEDKDWNKDYGTNQTNLGMPNATDKGTVNMEVNSAGTVRNYQWGHDVPNVDGTVRDRRVDVDKYNNTHVELHAHAQKLELPVDDANKSVHGRIIKNNLCKKMIAVRCLA